MLKFLTMAEKKVIKFLQKIPSFREWQFQEKKVAVHIEVSRVWFNIKYNLLETLQSNPLKRLLINIVQALCS